MFQSNKNNRDRKSVGFRNKNQTKASRRVVLNWEGALEDRRLMATLTLTPSNNIGYLSGAGFNNSVSVSIASGNYIFEDTNLLDPMVLVPQIGTALTAVPLPFGANGFSISAVALTESITVQTLDGDDTVNIQDIAATTVSTFVDTASGLFDQINLGNPAGKLNTILGPVSMTDGVACGIQFNDSSSGLDTTYTIDTTTGLPYSLRLNTQPTTLFTWDNNFSRGVTLNGGAGNDMLLASFSDNVSLNGGAGNDTLVASSGSDTLEGGAGNDVFIVPVGTNTIDGGTGFDMILINGTNGNDFINVAQTLTNVNITVNLESSINTVSNINLIDVHGLVGDDSIFLSGNGIIAMVVHGDEGNDYVDATSFAALTTIYGGSGDDILGGGSAVDYIYGEAGDDIITGSAGNDQLSGGDGADTFIWNNGDGSDTVDGGTGQNVQTFNGSATVADVLSVNASSGRVIISRTLPTVVNIDMASVQTLNLNTLAGNDSITVNNLAGTDLNLVNIALGADTDLVIVNGTNVADNISAVTDGTNVKVLGVVPVVNILSPTLTDTLTINALQGDDMVKSGLGVDGLIGVILNGNEGNDTLSGDATLNGGAGNDVFIVPVGTNTIDGGTGNDTILVTGSEFTDSITVTQNATVNISVTSGSVTTSSINTVTNVEVINISAQAGNDTILSNGTGTIATYVFGDDGNDTINAAGLAALATIYGGSGNDIITGGSAVDYIYGEAGQDQIIGGPGNDQLSGGEDSDTFVWNSGDGNDTIDGGTGTDALITNGTSGSDCFTIAPDGTFVTQARVTIEVPTLAQNGSLLAGNLEHVSLVGGAGADHFQVKSLVPTAVVAVDIDMGAGAGVQDMAIVTTSNAGSVLTATPSATNATVDVNGLSALVRLYNTTLDDVLAIQGGYGDDKISVSPQTLTLIQVQVDGGGGNDLITGSTMASGGDGNDTIIGTPGPDTLLGGMGDDSISGFGDDDLILGDATSNGGLIGLTADFTCSSGEVIIPFAILPITDVDGGNDTLLGGTGNDSIQGNGGDDSILGGTGDDSIYGGLGNDHIEGNTGDDSLCGGPDIDELVDATLDGSDTIFGGNGNDAINGDAGDDFLNGGVGNDQLWGNDGNDTIGVFVYNGVTQFEPGNDSMIGGLGDDLIAGALVDSTGKPVNDGNDVMFGQEGNDTIWGGAGGDMIYGGDGDDVMLGGTPLTANTLHAPRNGKLPNDGNDTMFGGNGFDKVDGGNNNNLLDAGNDGIRETVLGGKGNDMGYSHTLQDPVNFDVLALDGGFNHKFCDGGLEEPPVPAASCTYIAWAIPSNFFTGVNTLKNGDIVEHPSLDYRTKPNNGPNGPVIKSVKIQSSKVTVSKTILVKSAVSKSSTSFAGKSKTVGKLSSGLGKLQVAKG